MNRKKLTLQMQDGTGYGSVDKRVVIYIGEGSDIDINEIGKKVKEVLL